MASYLQTVAGPIVLVGHSYGGFIITNAAAGNPNVNAPGAHDQDAGHAVAAPAMKAATT